MRDRNENKTWSDGIGVATDSCLRVQMELS